MNKYTLEDMKNKIGYIPSHNMKGKYRVLVETNLVENESWYSFIRIDGNEENLQFLYEQLEKIEDWNVDDDNTTSVFIMDMDRSVCAQTAKEMSKIDINHCMFHRKFDGVLKRIDFQFQSKDSSRKKIKKVHKLLEYGGIDEFIDDEDVDLEDINFEDDSDSSDDSSYDSSSDSGSDSSSCSEKLNKAAVKKYRHKK